MDRRGATRPATGLAQGRQGPRRRDARAAILIIALTGGLGLVPTAVSGAPSEARSGRVPRAMPRARIDAPRFRDPRAPTLRPADDGIIHWNTPNRDGNLGGPGTGGGGGGGG